MLFYIQPKSEGTGGSSQRSVNSPRRAEITRTLCPGLKPARSSQSPQRRIFGFIPRVQKSPMASIFNTRSRVSGKGAGDSFVSGGSDKAVVLELF
jgi:hypothetical protein